MIRVIEWTGVILGLASVVVLVGCVLLVAVRVALDSKPGATTPRPDSGRAVPSRDVNGGRTIVRGEQGKNRRRS